MYAFSGKLLFRFAVAVYFIAALAVLALRYAVLPRIDEWRPQIEAVVTRMLDAPVRIGHIAADWKGLHPRLSFDQLYIDDAQGQRVLAVPQARATLSWRSVLLLEPRLLSLEVSGLDVAMRRDGQGGVWLAGRELLSSRSGHDGRARGGVRWLLAQRELVVRDATLRWTDGQRDASAELVLSDAELRLHNTLLGSRVALTARPPVGHAARVTVLADVKHDVLSLSRTDPKAWSGQLYVQLDDAAPPAWQSWLNLPVDVGRLAARGWLDVKHGEPSWAVADLALRDMGWRHGESGEDDPGVWVQADALDVRLEGSPRDLLAGGFEAFTAATPRPVNLAAQLTGRNVMLAWPGVLPMPLPTVQSLTADLTVERSEVQGWTVLMRQLDLSNADLSARLQGVWHSAGRTSAGTLDMQGQVAHIALNAVHCYLPVAVDARVRAWLRTGLVSGQAHGIALTVRGDLGDLPFGESGQFRLSGGMRDAVIDYAPGKGGPNQGWPRLEQLTGTFDLARAALTLRAQNGRIRTGKAAQVTLERVVADIPELTHKAPMLHIDGNTSGQAQDYLAMMRESPLGKLLGHAFDQTQGKGQWRVPLRLDIPLLNAAQTRVQGQVQFAGGSLTIRPDAPALTGLDGVLAFSDEGVSADGLRGRLLGGPMRVSGELSRQGKGLCVDGTLQADALSKQWPAPALRRLLGQTDYTARLIWRARGLVDLHVESSLAGLGIDLPAPLNKPAQTALPLKAIWGPGRGGVPGRWLDVQLGKVVDLALEQSPAQDGSYFRRGALGVYRAAPEVAQGLSLDVALPELDANAWMETMTVLTAPTGQSRQTVRSLLPDVVAMRLHSAAVRLPFMRLHDVALDVSRVNAGWQAALRAREAAGSWSWRAATVETPGKWVGRFDHVTLDDAGRDDGATPDDLFADDAVLDFPDVDVQVKQLSLYGRELGALAFSGLNVERNRIWRVDKLTIANADATLAGHGVWRLTGDARALELDTSLNILDLGRLLDRLGDSDWVVGGRGTVTGRLVWRNLPWQFRYSDLAGNMTLALEQGVFSRLNSPSARLLGLLSLQSVSKLARLDIDPGAMLRDGFRFDDIRADLKMTRGTVHAESIKIDSPIAAIALAGDTDLSSQRWNLEAAVVPKLDASGAAIAAGIINPLVGLGALLTQWLLKEPLARALTARYTVTGTWSDPVLTSLNDKPASSSRTAEDMGAAN